MSLARGEIASARHPYNDSTDSARRRPTSPCSGCTNRAPRPGNGTVTGRIDPFGQRITNATCEGGPVRPSPATAARSGAKRTVTRRRSAFLSLSTSMCGCSQATSSDAPLTSTKPRVDSRPGTTFASKPAPAQQIFDRNTVSPSTSRRTRHTPGLSGFRSHTSLRAARHETWAAGTRRCAPLGSMEYSAGGSW